MSNEAKERKIRNKESSVALLRHNNIEFTEHNKGTHLKVTHNGDCYDFWPSTGKFCKEGSGVYARGVFNLLKILGV